MTGLEGLSADRRALLERELARRRQLRARPSSIPRRPAGAPPELSMAQRRLWFLDQVAPGRSAYNATMTMRLAGRLDPPVLRRALDEIVERHEALRTVGTDSGGQPRAHLLPDPGVFWAEADLSEDPPDRDSMGERLRADARRPFDLATDVLLRAFLYRAGADDHVLMLVLHHLASDGWSRSILFTELTVLYNAFLAGEPSPLAPLPLQYSDYAAWQSQSLADGSMDRDIQFWTDELDGADLLLDLPTDLPRPKVPTFTGSRIGMESGPELEPAVRELARRESATYFMAMMAATGAFLHLLTGQEDILLGSPVANRQRPELEPLIGFFVNTLVFRVRLHGAPTFRELLRRCRSTTIAGLGHQEMPFDRLVEIINPKRQGGRNPLFQVNYRMQGVAPPTPQFTGVTSSRMYTDTGAARFDLAVGFVDGPGPVRGYIEYNDALFHPATAAAWSEALIDLVVTLVQRPDVRIDELGAETVRRIHAARAAAAAAEAPPTRSIRARRTG